MLTHPEFNPQTTAREAASAFASTISGKTVVIVGVSPNSLGETLALAIASQNPGLLILASRTDAKLREVAKQVATGSPSTNVKLILLNLSSQVSIRQAADQIREVTQKINILINNAATNPGTHEFTPERIEMQFGSNHIGPFLLTNLLLPELRNAAKVTSHGSTRIVNVSSTGHRLSPIRFHDYNFEGKEVPLDERPPVNLPESLTRTSEGAYNPFLAYGQSKTGNILFSIFLREHLHGSGILSFAVHPGSIWTNLSRSLDDEQRDFIARTGDFSKNQDQGAAPMVVAAFDPSLNNSNPSDIYFDECKIADPAPHARSLQVATKLWELSEQLIFRPQHQD
ncbi:NAD(P)-binding protein [Viridothelium virens]|uniref:NAD(P)-binding protein n=1 Tax=Viridothelium virens TaxID=1048519 RepID=A0A6A6H0N8_VIRVR|nr:NAD(P)-binding protein [Viridothelium virens]